MAKGVLLVCFFLFAFTHVHGQDLITRTDSVVIKATVLEINAKRISYRLFQKPDTLRYQISTKDVLTVQMQDGTIKRFSTPAATSNFNQGKATNFNYEQSLEHNIISVAPLDLLFNNLFISYERISASGKIGIKIPFILNLTDEDYYSYEDFRRNNRFGMGIEINFYPSGQGKFRYFYGPSIQHRSFWAYYYNYQANSGQEDKVNAQMWALAFKSGFNLQLNRRLSLSMDAGIGYRFFNTPEIPAYQDTYFMRNRVSIPGNVHLGFRF